MGIRESSRLDLPLSRLRIVYDRGVFRDCVVETEGGEEIARLPAHRSELVALGNGLGELTVALHADWCRVEHIEGEGG